MRSGAGSGDDALAVRVQIIGRAGCHLCDEAEAVVSEVCVQRGVRYEGLLHYGEGLRPYQLEFFFAAFVDAFVQRFDLSVQTFSYLEGFFRFELGLYVIQAVLVLFIDGAKTIPE